MSQEGHSEQLLFFALFYQSTPSCLKVRGGVGGCLWGGGPCDFSVRPSPFGLDFETLDFGLGLDIWYRVCENLLTATGSKVKIQNFLCPPDASQRGS